MLPDVTHKDPQAQVHLRRSSTDHDGSAVPTSEARKRKFFARPGHVSFNERSQTPATLKVESYGRHGVIGSNSIDHLAASVVGGWDGGSMTTKGDDEGTPPPNHLGS